MIVVRRGGTIKSTANQEQIEPPSGTGEPDKTRRDGDQGGLVVEISSVETRDLFIRQFETFIIIS